MLRAVRDDRDDARTVGGVVVGGQQRRQVRAGAGDEDHEPARRAGGRGGALGRLVRHAPTLPAQRDPVRTAVRRPPFVGENARVSNPYAPPEHRPGTPDDAPVQDAPVWPPAGAPSPAPVVPEPPQPADPEGTARATSLTRLFAVLVLASVLVATLRLPWQAAALPFALAAIVVGVRAIVVAVRARARGLAPVLAVGLVVALLLDARPERPAGAVAGAAGQAGVPRAAP